VLINTTTEVRLIAGDAAQQIVPGLLGVRDEPIGGSPATRAVVRITEPPAGPCPYAHSSSSAVFGADHRHSGMHVLRWACWGSHGLAGAGMAESNLGRARMISTNCSTEH